MIAILACATTACPVLCGHHKIYCLVWVSVFSLCWSFKLLKIPSILPVDLLAEIREVTEIRSVRLGRGHYLVADHEDLVEGISRNRAACLPEVGMACHPRGHSLVSR